MSTFLSGLLANIVKWVLEKGARFLMRRYEAWREAEEIEKDYENTAGQLKKTVSELKKLKLERDQEAEKGNKAAVDSYNRHIKQKERELRDAAVRNNADFNNVFK